MKRQAMRQLTRRGALARTVYEQTLLEQEDLAPASIRTTLSDVCRVIAWHEHHVDTGVCIFIPQILTPPAIPRYHAYLHMDQRLRSAPLNRFFVSLQRSCCWTMPKQFIHSGPSAPVKLVGEVDGAPRHFHDQEEHVLVGEPGMIGNRRLKPSLGHEGETGYAG